MDFILDTSICVHWLKGNRRVADRIDVRPTSVVTITFITVAELYFGAYKSGRVEHNVAEVDHLVAAVRVLESTPAASKRFGQIKAQLQQRGKPLDDADLFIAAFALEQDAVLVTDNEKHFRRITGLKVKNWLRDSG